LGLGGGSGSPFLPTLVIVSVMNNAIVAPTEIRIAATTNSNANLRIKFPEQTILSKYLNEEIRRYVQDSTANRNQLPQKHPK
jgi:hypothetical protein